MKFISVRELKHRAGALLQRVRRGEKIVVTVHGKPAAALVRVPENGLDVLLLSDRLGWVKLADSALSFWDNAEDEAWDDA